MERIKKYTWVIIPLILSFMMLILQTNNIVLNSLQFNRVNIKSYEVWRLITAHFVHWSWNHLIWDVLTFFMLGMLCYYINKRAFWVLVFFTSVTVSCVIWFFSPDLLLYRGISGVDIAFYSYLSLYLINRYYKSDTYFFTLGLISFILLMIKVGYECLTGNTVFVTGDGYETLEIVHIAGLATGSLTGLLKMY